MGEGRGACGAPLKGAGSCEALSSIIMSGEEGSCIVIVDVGGAAEEGDAMLDSEERLLLEDWKTECVSPVCWGLVKDG